MTIEQLKEDIDSAIKDSGIHRLIICSYLKISLAMLDDFIYGRVSIPDEKLQRLLKLINKEVVYK